MSTYCAPCLADLALVREAVTTVSGTAACVAHAVLLTHPGDNPQQRLTRLSDLRAMAEEKLPNATEQDRPRLELLVQEYALAGAMDMTVPLKELAGDRAPRPPKPRRNRGRDRREGGLPGQPGQPGQPGGRPLVAADGAPETTMSPEPPGAVQPAEPSLTPGMPAEAPQGVPVAQEGSGAAAPTAPAPEPTAPAPTPAPAPEPPASAPSSAPEPQAAPQGLAQPEGVQAAPATDVPAPARPAADADAPGADQG